MVMYNRKILKNVIGGCYATNFSLATPANVKLFQSFLNTAPDPKCEANRGGREGREAEEEGGGEGGGRREEGREKEDNCNVRREKNESYMYVRGGNKECYLSPLESCSDDPAVVMIDIFSSPLPAGNSMSLALEAAFSYFVGDINSNGGTNATERDRGEVREGGRKGGRDRRREREREGGTDGWTDGRTEREREGGRDGWMDGRTDREREGERDRRREGGREGGRGGHLCHWLLFRVTGTDIHVEMSWQHGTLATWYLGNMVPWQGVCS